MCLQLKNFFFIIPCVFLLYYYCHWFDRYNLLYIYSREEKLFLVQNIPERVPKLSKVDVLIIRSPSSDDSLIILWHCITVDFRRKAANSFGNS